MLNVGDFVTRKSYNNDIIFKVIEIKGDIYYLKGLYIRLYADSKLDDLVKCDSTECMDSFRPSVSDYREFDRDLYFYLPGIVLHIDAVYFDN